MTADTGDIYSRVPIFDGFADVMDPARYRPLPDDWLIGLTDVVSSTQAIEAGRYKAVNTAGASVIAAVTNALDGRKFPFVFGGDGASFAVAARRRRTRARRARRDRGVDARRPGARPARRAGPRVRREGRGHNVNVARFGPSKNVSFAMFMGGGLAWAERAMKAGQFAVPAAAPGTRPDLSGLSCRWNDIPATRGLILSLVVAPVDPWRSRVPQRWSKTCWPNWKKATKSRARCPTARRTSAGRRRDSISKPTRHASAASPFPRGGSSCSCRR